jgi:hypothetical protein
MSRCNHNETWMLVKISQAGTTSQQGGFVAYLDGHSHRCGRCSPSLRGFTHCDPLRYASFGHSGSAPERCRHVTGEPAIAAPRWHGHEGLDSCLGRIGDILGPGSLQNILGAGALGPIVRVHGNQHMTFLDLPLIALGLIFRNP